MRERSESGTNGAAHVVVVDDDGDVCDALATLIEIDGYESVVFTDGREALGYLRDVPDLDWPRLILVDATMPHLDGWQFLEELRAITEGQQTHAFLISADTRLDENRARGLGASGVLRKPFDAVTLSDIIRLHCAGRHAGAPAGDAPPPL